MYVIKNLDTGKYVAKPGSEHSYVTNLQNARVFRTREEARRDCCGNEAVLSIESAMGSC